MSEAATVAESHLGEAIPADDLLPNGISAETGRPLPDLDVSRLVGRVVGNAKLTDEATLGGQRVASSIQRYGMRIGYDPERLEQAGWGLVLPADVDPAPLRAALAPLLDRRRAEAGAEQFKIFDGPAGVRPGEDALTWLFRQGEGGRYGPGLGAVDPVSGVPYYLLLVGDQDQIPMTFQYMLDLYWAVGRLSFDAPGGLAAYARSVVDYEVAGYPPQRRKQAALFAPAFDGATTMFEQAVARPYAEGEGARPSVPTRRRFRLDALRGPSATKAALVDLLRGARPQGRPALLFSGSHGMAFRPDDPRLPSLQGALVCQDFQGGPINSDHWFSAADLPADAEVHGMVHFLFACYGGAWGRTDTFRDGPGGTSADVAPTSGFAQLPQAMLTHRNGGALAVVAHVDRAWAYSFRTANNSTQSGDILDVLEGLLMGKRVGSAIDAFNARWAALSVPLADAMAAGNAGPAAAARLARLWIARDDARNYVVLGDPAVRLRVGDMVDAA